MLLYFSLTGKEHIFFREVAGCIRETAEETWLSAFQPDDPAVPMPFQQTIQQWMEAVDRPMRASIADHETVLIAKESRLLTEHLEQLAWQQPPQWQWVPHHGLVHLWTMRCTNKMALPRGCISINDRVAYYGHYQLRGTKWTLCNACYNNLSPNDIAELLKNTTYLQSIV